MNPADGHAVLQLHGVVAGDRPAAMLGHRGVTSGGMAGLARRDVDSPGQVPRELDPAPAVPVARQPHQELGVAAEPVSRLATLGASFIDGRWVVATG